MEVVKQVAIVAPVGASLGVVIQAALRSRGWSTGLLSAVPPGEGRPGRTRSRTLVVIEDDGGRVRASLPPRIALDDFVCIGSIRSLAALIPLAARGATVLNQAAPILVLLRLVEQALLTAPADPAHAELARHSGPAAILQRQSEAAMLARLTPAENEVLRGMVAGLSATQIAARSQHSVHTIRSQIRAVLGKLDVGSQIAAVALAHRAGDHDWLNRARATFTNFGDDGWYSVDDA